VQQVGRSKREKHDWIGGSGDWIRQKLQNLQISRIQSTGLVFQATGLGSNSRPPNPVDWMLFQATGFVRFQFNEGPFCVSKRSKFKAHCDELNYLSLIPYYVNYLRWPECSSQITSQLGKYIFLRRSIIVTNV
jgi:hypothetical protein